MMLLDVVFRRIIREWRLMGILLFAICLVSAFLALGPMYVRAIATVEFETRLQSLDVSDFRLDISNDEPITEEMTTLIDDTVDDLVSDVKVYNVSNMLFQNGLLFARVATYRDFDSLFTLVDGRLPQSGNDETLEAVITTETLSRIRDLNPRYEDFDVGELIHIGSPQDQIYAEVVGIVEATIPEGDPFWNRHEFVFGNIRTMIDFDEIDFSLIVPESMFNSQYADVLANAEAGGITYNWQLNINSDVVTTNQLSAISRDVEQLSTALRSIHPDINMQFGLDNLIKDFEESIVTTEGPVILLSLLIMVLMLYNLVTTVILILEQQKREWAVISSRGGSTRQLVIIHFLTMVVLSIGAFLLGPIIALGILFILTLVGPQADILDVSSIDGIPTTTFSLGVVVSVIAVIVLTAVSLPLARSSFSNIRSSSSRPPTRPLWARYFLDVIFLVVGLVFLLRFYSLALEQSGQSPDDLLRQPSQLLAVLASRVSDTNGITDPFNLAGPVLVLAGLTLLWLRLFPWLMRLTQIMISRLNRLTLNLALWTVERDPGHYGQLVLLLVGTLALGTASLALSETQNRGAWDKAIHDVGSQVNVSIDPWNADVTRDWGALPTVTTALPLLVSEWDDAIPGETVSLIGIDTEQTAEIMPEYADMLAILGEAPEPEISGIPIPSNSRELSLDVYAEASSDGITETVIALEMLNGSGVIVVIPMETSDVTASGEFVEYRATLSGQFGRAPWRVVGIRFLTERELEITFEHTVYLDNLVAYSLEGDETLVYGFENADYDLLSWESRSIQFSGLYAPTNELDLLTEGESSLRVRHRIVRSNRVYVSLLFNEMDIQPIPVLVSQFFADRIGLRTGLRRPLEAGDTLLSEIELPINADADIRSVRIYYHVEGIIDNFPGVDRGAPYLISRIDLLRGQLNHEVDISNYFEVNRMLLATAGREPSPALIHTLAEIPEISDMNYAWNRYKEIQRDPLSNAITGMLFAGFWVSLGLILLDFAFYMAVTTRQRASSFAVLRAIGWERQNIWGLLTFEQVAFITPALLVGSILGVVLAYMILPFLGIEGVSSLQIPIVAFLLLVAILVGAFSTVLAVTAILLQRIDINQMIRVVE